MTLKQLIWKICKFFFFFADHFYNFIGMSQKLVIVESPAKAKTIEKYLGKNFLVKSSIGHIRDLPKKGGLGIDIDNGFLPRYEVSQDKKSVVEELKKENLRDFQKKLAKTEQMFIDDMSTITYNYRSKSNSGS